MSRSRNEAVADIDTAIELFCKEAESRRSLPVNARGRRRSGQQIAAAVRQASAGKRRLAGRRLLKRFRADTGCDGVIDWEAFHRWLQEHMPELTFLKIVLSVISILLIL